VQGVQTVVLVVLVLVVLVLVVLVLVVLVLVDVLVVVEVVPLVQAALRVKVDADGQDPLQAWPAAQQVRLVPLPHGVLPAGQPQKPRLWSMHGTPALQHEVPHGVVPDGQQQEVVGSEQMPPRGQQPCPHVAAPDGHVTAAPLNGRRSVAAAAAAPAAPSTLRAPRRDVGRAILRDRSSNGSLMPRSMYRGWPPALRESPEV
jgi:hypothetical protein